MPDAARYRTHDLRRGHARGLQKLGEHSETMRREGQWKSRRVMVSNYLDDELELDGAIDGTPLNEVMSSSDEDAL